jgi:putative chitinase
MITKQQLLEIVPGASHSKLNLDDLCANLTEVLEKMVDEYHFSTVNRRAAFIAQCAHESGSFCHVSENLNYKAEGLTKIFHKYFPDLDHATPYAHNPEKIANKVYASRMGNGDEHSGDGYKFRGRGFIQLTGRDNYTKCGHAIGVDLVDNPDYLLSPKGALQSAIWFWNANNLNTLADSDDILHITKKINGGTIGLEERTHLYQKAKQVLSVSV